MRACECQVPSGGSLLMSEGARQLLLAIGITDHSATTSWGL